MDTFTLEGTRYYQQGRKCGKPGCHCRSGKLHGPYWYARPADGGKVRYIGKALPECLDRTRQAHDRLLSRMVSEKHCALRQYKALARLSRNETLHDGDREILGALGFGDALVSPGTR